MRRRGTLLLDLAEDKETIWKGIRSRRRDEIRQAEKLGIEITLEATAAIRAEWAELLIRHLKQVGVGLNKKWLFDNLGLSDGGPTKTPFYTALLDGKLLSGELFSIRGAKSGPGMALSMMYSATVKEAKESSPGHALLIWRSIQDAMASGYREYDFGGWNCYRPDQRGVNAWKESFGGNVWWWITDEEPNPEQATEEAKAGVSGPIKIWFDDGHVSLYEHGLELFKKLGITPTLALVTGYVGKDLEVSNKVYPIMDLKMLRALLDAGWEIASHSVSHRNISELSLEEAKAELLESKNWIEENLGIKVTKFAAPYDDLTSEQIRLAKSIYEYVRPRIPPRPPQEEGIHAIFHTVEKNKGIYHFRTGKPTDIGFLNFLNLSVHPMQEALLQRGPLKDLGKTNLRTYNGVRAVQNYSSSKLQPAEAEAFRELKPGDVLDLGCGTGRTTRHLADLGMRVIGLDIAPKMIQAAQSFNPDLEFRVGDASDLSGFRDESFDHVIFSFNGLDCLYPLSLRFKCLEEIHRVLRRGGILIYSTHNLRWMEDHPKKNILLGENYYRHDAPYGPTIVYASTPDEQEKQLAAHGFLLLRVYEPESPWIYYKAEKKPSPGPSPRPGA